LWKVVDTFTIVNQNMIMKSSRKPVVKSADRVLDLLELLARKGRPLTHGELCAELGVPKSSLSQLAGNLLDRGYLTFHPGPNTYALGDALARLVSQRRRSMALPDIAQPITERITRLTGESSSLNLRRDDLMQRVCGANSTQPLTFSMTVGEFAPMYAVSSGKVLLAQLDREELDAYFARTPLRRITPHTITSMTGLRKQLREVRVQGVAWSIEEYTPGIVGAAVPVFGATGQAIGAFNVALPAVRDRPEHRRLIVRTLQDAARTLQRDVASASAQM
jgi:DNA-binding IclR family transcriptional regulator